MEIQSETRQTGHLILLPGVLVGWGTGIGNNTLWLLNVFVTWESQAGKGKVIAGFILIPPARPKPPPPLPAPKPWTCSFSSRGLSCGTHTAEGGGEGRVEARRRGRQGGIWACCRACAFREQQVGSTDRGSVKGGFGGGGTGAEHGGDVSAPPGRHPARLSRGQREPQPEQER